MFNKNSIIGIVVSIIFLGGIVWAAKVTTADPKTQNETASSQGILSTDEKSFDFGTVSMAKGTVTHAFKIKNTGTETVSIDKLYTSCMCTVATWVKGNDKAGPFGMPGHSFTPSIERELKPGEEATIEATFDPAAHGPAGVGKIQRVVVLESNAGAPFEFEFTATVTP